MNGIATGLLAQVVLAACANVAVYEGGGGWGNRHEGTPFIQAAQGTPQRFGFLPALYWT